METDLVSLSVIALLAFLCPLVAQNIPGKPIPETVLLLIGGMLLGPHAVGAIATDSAVGLLSDLGLGFLFLLAGYEINPSTITGTEGRRGLVTWVVTFAIACGAVILWPEFDLFGFDGLAVAIALTTTAIGTLLPILSERGLMGTRVGEEVLAYGTWGELAPVIAMTLLLTTRAKWVTIVVLAAFVALAMLAAVIPNHARRAGSFVFRFIERNADSNAQMVMRAIMVLLVGLTTLSAVFNLDIVLGAFAAGFILRFVVPEGSQGMEAKLSAVAFGFFIPLFFVVSGAKVDLAAVGQDPGLLVLFIGLLLVVRMVPVFVGLSTGRRSRTMDVRERLSVAFYCTTALPLIVAVTAVAVDAGAMSQATASVLVAAGGITVLIMPLFAQAVMRGADAELGEAAREIAAQPRRTVAIIKEHHRQASRRVRERRAVFGRAGQDDGEPGALGVEAGGEGAEGEGGHSAPRP